IFAAMLSLVFALALAGTRRTLPRISSRLVICHSLLSRVAVCAFAGLIAVSPPSASAQTCSTTGVQNVAVLLINFQDAAISTTAQQAYDAFFDTSSGRSLNGYWQEASYAQTSASGSIFGPFTIGPSSSYTCAVFEQLASDVIAAASA